MRRLFSFLFASTLLVSGAHAGPTQTILHTSGNSWETGGFPTSEIGDEFQAVGILTDIGAPLLWNTSLYSYTWYLRGAISLGESINGTTHIANYAGGQLTFYVDALPTNHDYGANPPNATSPSTFTDGFSTYLDATVGELTVTWDEITGTGSMLGTVTFVGGDLFPMLSDPAGWTFGSNIAGFSPDGYDLELNGQVFVQGPSAIDESTWGSIKSLYR